MVREWTPTETDRAAMQLAIDMVRAEGEDRVRWLEGRSFCDAGTLCAYHCQYRVLRLKPWQWPPCWIDPKNIDAELAAPPDQSGRRRAAQLLREMLALGISQYHPDPVAAVAEAKRNSAA
jgi:hypothetical protein